MPQKKLPAVFMRGGTSKAIIFHARDLPASRAEWEPIFLSVIGSPDPNMRQLNGMGGGVSSLSKVCVIGPPTHPDADVDYTFAQVLIDKARVDYNSNCGNMSSAIGPFAVDEGLVPKPRDGDAVVRIHNTNTKKIIVSRFGMDGDEAAVAGDMALDGVAGTGAPIRLEFMEPGGAKTGKLLPDRQGRRHAGGAGARPRAGEHGRCRQSVRVRAGRGDRRHRDRAADRDRAAMRSCWPSWRPSAARRRWRWGSRPTSRRPATSACRSSRSWRRPVAMSVLSGRKLAPADMDIAVRMMSNGQAHRATPLTGALCLAVATRIPGSIPNEMARRLAEGASQIRIGARLGRHRRRCQDRPGQGRPAPRRVRRRLPHRPPPVRRPRALSGGRLTSSPEKRRTLDGP